MSRSKENNQPNKQKKKKTRSTWECDKCGRVKDVYSTSKKVPNKWTWVQLSGLAKKLLCFDCSFKRNKDEEPSILEPKTVEDVKKEENNK